MDILSKKDDCRISVNDLLPAAKKLNFFKKGISIEPEALNKFTFTFPFISLKLPTFPWKKILWWLYDCRRNRRSM